MFMLRGTNLVIHPETDVYFVTGLLLHGEALRYPLPSGRVDLERFQRCHCGGVPLTEGCISIHDRFGRAMLSSSDCMTFRVIGSALGIKPAGWNIAPVEVREFL